MQASLVALRRLGDLGDRGRPRGRRVLVEEGPAALPLLDDLVLEELGELDDVLVGRANLQLLHRCVKLNKVPRGLGRAARLRFSFRGVMRFYV